MYEYMYYYMYGFSITKKYAHNFFDVDFRYRIQNQKKKMLNVTPFT